MTTPMPTPPTDRPAPSGPGGALALLGGLAGGVVAVAATTFANDAMHAARRQYAADFRPPLGRFLLFGVAFVVVGALFGGLSFAARRLDRTSGLPLLAGAFVPPLFVIAVTWANIAHWLLERTSAALPAPIRLAPFTVQTILFVAVGILLVEFVALLRRA